MTLRNQSLTNKLEQSSKPAVELDELAQQREEELNPMNYAKVFANDQYVVFKPQDDGT